MKNRLNEIATEAMKLKSPGQIMLEKKISDYTKKQPKHKPNKQPRTDHMIVARKNGSHVDILKDPFWSKVCDPDRMDEVHLYIDTKTVPEGNDLYLYSIMANSLFRRAFDRVHQSQCEYPVQRLQSNGRDIQYHGCQITSLHAKGNDKGHLIITVEFIGPHIGSDDVNIKYDYDADKGKIVGGVDEYIGPDHIHVTMS